VKLSRHGEATATVQAHIQGAASLQTALVALRHRLQPDAGDLEPLDFRGRTIVAPTTHRFAEDSRSSSESICETSISANAQARFIPDAFVLNPG
jgi:hypothetical protein